VIVVSDTSPISNLISIGLLELLRDMYEEVVIPPAVREELERCHTSLPPFIETSEVVNSALADRIAAELDRGEAEAIVLAKELGADFLLIDETLGRARARSEGVRVIGLLGVLIIAKRKTLISSVKEIVHRLDQEAGFYVSHDLREEVLRAAGEI